MRVTPLKTWALEARSWERDLLDPLIGISMLELGNKIKAGISYKSMFEGLGFRHVSVDLNGKNGARPLDLRQPLELGRFDMVTNLGTSEHVSPGKIAGQAACWRNMLEALNVDGVLVSATPLPGAECWRTHGCWYPTADFFTELALRNGLRVERLYDDGRLVFARLLRLTDVPFEMPTRGMYHNRNWRTSSDNIC